MKNNNKKSNLVSKAFCCFRSHIEKDQEFGNQMVNQRESNELIKNMLSDDHLNTSLGNIDSSSGGSGGSGENLDTNINSSPSVSPYHFEVISDSDQVPEDENAPQNLEQEQEQDKLQNIDISQEEEKEEEKDDYTQQDIQQDTQQDKKESDEVQGEIQDDCKENSNNNSCDAVANSPLHSDNNQDDNNQAELIEELKEELDVRAKIVSNQDNANQDDGNQDDTKLNTRQFGLSSVDVKLDLAEGRNSHSESNLDSLRKAIADIKIDSIEENESDSLVANNGSRPDTPRPASLEELVSKADKGIDTDTNLLSPRTFEAIQESSLSKYRSSSSDENIL